MALITTSDLATYIGVASVDPTRGQLLIDKVSQTIKNYCLSSLELVNNDVYTVVFDRASDVILLPDGPIVNVDSVTEAGVLLTVDVDYYVAGTRTLRRIGGVGVTQTWPYPYVSVPMRPWAIAPKKTVIQYDHGYATIPDDVKGVALAVASRTWAFLQAPSLAFEDTYQTPTEGRGFAPDIVLLPAEREVLDPYSMVTVG